MIKKKRYSSLSTSLELINVLNASRVQNKPRLGVLLFVSCLRSSVFLFVCFPPNANGSFARGVCVVCMLGGMFCLVISVGQQLLCFLRTPVGNNKTNVIDQVASRYAYVASYGGPAFLFCMCSTCVLLLALFMLFSCVFSCVCVMFVFLFVLQSGVYCVCHLESGAFVLCVFYACVVV